MISPAQIPYYNQQEKRDKFMYRQRSITWFQASAVVISSIIGGGVLDIPRIAAATADSGAPLITLAGIAIALLGIWLITVLGMRFPKENLFQYSQHILGKPVAYSVNLCMVLFFVILTALTVRQFGEVVVSAVLRKTPIEVTIIILLLLATVTTRRNIIRFSYIHMFYLPFILGPVLGIALISLQNAEVLNLQPIIGNHPKDVIGGIVHHSIVSKLLDYHVDHSLYEKTREIIEIQYAWRDYCWIIVFHHRYLNCCCFRPSRDYSTDLANTGNSKINFPSR